jgi:maleylacetoacetate isomerase
MPDKRTLYSYWRSSAAYRVRIALNLKGLDYAITPVHLLRDGGEQHADEYRAMNPQQLVPTLVDGGNVVRESMAIIEYLEEAYPDTPRLLPEDPAGRARVRSLALIAAADTHPLNNLRVLQYLENELGLDGAARVAWIRRWQTDCFDAYEARLARERGTGVFCHGDRPGLADICLVAQVINAQRISFDFSPYPTVTRIFEEAQAFDAFARAMPDRQPDAE